MRVKVSDFIAEYLVSKGIRCNFTVPGGGAMHLNMSFGHQEGMRNVFVQHEQAAAIAAEAYARVTGVPGFVCCTTGPGGTNTLTGVLGAWLDSIPMLIVSGQVRYATTARYSGLPLRAMGDQEYDITPLVSHMTKYAEMVTDPLSIKYHLDKALHLATCGRPGPVWLDVPLDVQGALVDTDQLIEFNPDDIEDDSAPKVSSELIDQVVSHLRSAKRPVLNIGNGVRIADAYEDLQQLIKLLNMPVVNGFDSIDTIPFDDSLYVGRAGLMGDRAGNFAVQNCDLFLSIGSRLSARQVGYNVKSWARAACTIVEDVDAFELKKPSIRVDLPVHADAREFIQELVKVLANDPVEPNGEWNERCQQWKRTYPVVTEAMHSENRAVNAYHFIDILGKELPASQIVVTGNGTAYVASSQALKIKEGQRYVSNSGAASMGYDLPAAIGAAFAAPGKTIVCLSGDGSIQMNLQELQTIAFHNLPIKTFVINNAGYHSMRQTEGNLFPELTPVGIGPETGDLSFPSIKRISEAYGIRYVSASKNDKVQQAVLDTLQGDGPAICELFCVTDQKFEPKSATKKLEDGTLVSPPLEDLAPFLSREELASNMLIPLWEG